MPQTIQEPQKWVNNGIFRVLRWQHKTKAVKPRIKIIPDVQESPDKNRTNQRGTGTGTGTGVRGRKSKDKEKVTDPDNEYRIYLICKQKEDDPRSLFFRILYSGGVKGEGVSPSVKFENQLVNPIIPIGFVRKTTHFFLMIIRHDIKANFKSMMYTNYFKVLSATDLKSMGGDVNNVDYKSKANILTPVPKENVLRTWFKFLTDEVNWYNYCNNNLFPKVRESDLVNDDDIGSGEFSDESSGEDSYNNNNNNNNVAGNNDNNNNNLDNVSGEIHENVNMNNNNNNNTNTSRNTSSLSHEGQPNPNSQLHPQQPPPSTETHHFEQFGHTSFEENPFLQIPLNSGSSNHGIFGDSLTNQGIIHNNNAHHNYVTDDPYHNQHQSHFHPYQQGTPYSESIFSNHHLNEDLFGTLREFEMSERRGAMNTTLDHMKEQTLYMKETRRFMINFNQFFEIYFNNGSGVSVLDEDYLKTLENSVNEEKRMFEELKLRFKKRKL